MPARTRRHVELLHLARPLRRYASGLHPDANAASFLVHQALSAAFGEAPGLRSSDRLEASLRDDIDRNHARGAHASLAEPQPCLEGCASARV